MLEQQLSSLLAQKAALAQQQAADLSDGRSGQKAAIIAMYKKETGALNAQISKARAKVEECQSKRDVLIAGSGFDGLGAFGLAIQKFMHGNRIRAGQLAILKDGFPLMQHAYTY